MTPYLTAVLVIVGISIVSVHVADALVPYDLVDELMELVK